MIAAIEFTEPSDTERAQWPECTAQYVAALEAEIARLRAALDANLCPECERIDEEDAWGEEVADG